MGWFKVITNLLGLGGSLVESWTTRKRVEAESKAELARLKARAQIEYASNAQQAEIQWDTTQARNAQTSWKDEYWTIVLSVPAILCFIPGMDKYVVRGFRALAETPEWYRYALLVAVAAAFGFRQLANLRKNKGP